MLQLIHEFVPFPNQALNDQVDIMDTVIFNMVLAFQSGQLPLDVIDFKFANIYLALQVLHHRQFFY